MCAHDHPEVSDPRAGAALVYLIVGLPGAGKTTLAKELETTASALRLTPDEWHIMLFGVQNPPDQRDLVEGKLIQLGMRAAELGANVVFDFGLWGKDERSALRWIAGTIGARSQLVCGPNSRRRISKNCEALKFHPSHRITRPGPSGPRSAGHLWPTSTQRPPRR